MAIALLLLGCTLAPLFGEPVLNYRWFSASEGKLAGQVVRDFAQTPDGSVWFASWGGGLSRYNGLEWKTFTTADGLANDYVRTIRCDPNGILWIGTRSGISRFDGKQWTSYTAKNFPALKEDSVFCILARMDGSLLFGMVSGFLYRFDPNGKAGQEWGLFADPSVFHNESVRSLLETRNGEIYAACNAGLFRYSNGRWQEYLLSDRFFSVTRDAQDRVWASGFTSIYRQEGESWEKIDLPIRESLQSIFAAEDGSIYVGTAIGVQRYKARQWQSFPLQEESAHPYIEAIQGLPDGSLWFGTRTGAQMIRPSDWSIFPSGTGLTYAFAASPDTDPVRIRGKGEVSFYTGGRWADKGSVLDCREECRVLSHRNDRLLLQETAALREYSLPSFSLLQTLPHPAEWKFFQSAQTRDGEIWIANEKELFQWVNGAWQATDCRKPFREKISSSSKKPETGPSGWPTTTVSSGAPTAALPGSRWPLLPLPSGASWTC